MENGPAHYAGRRGAFTKRYGGEIRFHETGIHMPVGDQNLGAFCPGRQLVDGGKGLGSGTRWVIHAAKPRLLRQFLKELKEYRKGRSQDRGGLGSLQKQSTCWRYAQGGKIKVCSEKTFAGASARPWRLKELIRR